MGLLLSVFLPLSLAFIMFSLGLGLTIADFSRVVRLPKAFLIGAVAQLVLLPAVAYLLLQAFNLPGVLALGVMILAFCPGGVTSNIITKLADGDLALSITLTAVISLLSVLTVPPLVAYFATALMGTDAPDVNVTSIGITMFLLTAVPVGIGVAVRHFATGFADKALGFVSKLATVLFVIIVIGALASNWSLFIDNIAVLGPILIVLNILMLAVGYGVARLGGLNLDQTKTVAIEAGVQNSTVGITVGSLIMASATGFPEVSLPAGVYGITMYAVTLPFVFWMRSRSSV